MRVARLFLLGASLFVCGNAFSQQATNSAGPQGIEIVSCNWIQIVISPQPTPPRPTSQTIERDSNRPLDPVDPTPKITQTPPTRNRYVYSATIINHEAKAIRALFWNYTFSDPVTHAELKRQRGFSSVKIGLNQKKTLEINSQTSPPKVVQAGSLNANGSAFEERIVIECIEYEDGSFWEAPNAGQACDKLRNWRRGGS